MNAASNVNRGNQEFSEPIANDRLEGFTAVVLGGFVANRGIGSLDPYLNLQRVLCVIQKLNNLVPGVHSSIENRNCGQGIPQAHADVFILNEPANVLGKSFGIGNGLG